jgi:hypothetical protein
MAYKETKVERRELRVEKVEKSEAISYTKATPMFRR